MGDQVDIKYVQVFIFFLVEEVGFFKFMLICFVGCYIEIFLLIEVL